MKMLKMIFGIATYCLCTTAHAYSLHIGDKSFVLNQNKYTSPALHISVDGATYYGALYSGDAPDKTLHVQTDNEYWLGQSCDAGTYSETGVSACTDCSIGHYCPGGARHVPCTYGAISCNTKSLVDEGALPDGAPVNTFMTSEQINEFMPQTDFSDWKQISCCSTQKLGKLEDLETLNDLTNACEAGTIGPGTYLFTARYNWKIENEYDSINGQLGQIANAHIVVFDHPVGYISMHGKDIFQHFIDTVHPTYTEWTISTEKPGAWRKNENITNISNLTDLPNNFNLCVYELK